MTASRMQSLALFGPNARLQKHHGHSVGDTVITHDHTTPSNPRSTDGWYDVVLCGLSPIPTLCFAIRPKGNRKKRRGKLPSSVPIKMFWQNISVRVKSCKGFRHMTTGHEQERQVVLSRLPTRTPLSIVEPLSIMVRHEQQQQQQRCFIKSEFGFPKLVPIGANMI